MIAFLSGRFSQIERDLERKMYFAAGEQDYEQATVERNRLQAVRALLERQRVANEGAGSFDAVAVAVDGTEANAQVFQVRDGVLADRQSFYLDNEAATPPARVAEEFLLQYYASALSIPALIVVQGDVEEGSDARAARRDAVRAPRRAGRDPRGRARRASGGCSSSPSATRGSRSTRRSSRPSGAASSASRRSTGCRPRSGSTRCPCGSSASTSRTSAAPTRSPRWSSSRAARRRSRDYRRFNIRDRRGQPTTSRRWKRCSTRRYAQWERQAEKSPYDADRDESFAALPEPHRHRRRQGPARGGPRAAAAGSASAAIAVVSLAKRIEEVFRPGVPAPLVLAHDTPELQLLQRVRDEAHRFAITHHRVRRDKAMTESIMDELPGIGPARKRALLQHFGSPDAVLGGHARGARARSPACPPRSARDLYTHLNRTGR